MSDNPFAKGKSKHKKTTSTGAGGSGGRNPTVVLSNPTPEVVEYVMDGVQFAPEEGDDSDRWYVPLRSKDGWEIPDDMREEYGIPEDVENVSFDEFFDITYNRNGEDIKYLRKHVVRIDKIPGIVVKPADGDGRWHPESVEQEPDDYPSEELYKKNGEPRTYVPHPDFTDGVESDEIITSGTTGAANNLLTGYHYTQMVKELGGRLEVGCPNPSDNVDEDGNMAWENHRERMRYVRFKLQDRDDDKYRDAAMEVGVPEEEVEANIEELDSEDGD